ncbi:hypothetical protein SK128_021901, partial [Halocaridina rubra]
PYKRHIQRDLMTQVTRKETIKESSDGYQGIAIITCVSDRGDKTRDDQFAKLGNDDYSGPIINKQLFML